MITLFFTLVCLQVTLNEVWMYHNKMDIIFIFPLSLEERPIYFGYEVLDIFGNINIMDNAKNAKKNHKHKDCLH